MMTAARFALLVEMRFKHVFAAPRPIDCSPQIQPIIPTPLHSAFPSGHATEIFIMARVLSELLAAGGSNFDPSWKEQIMLVANRIAVNRTVAGVHFPVDSMAGCILGLSLGDYLVARCKPTGGSYRDWTFDGTELHQLTRTDTKHDFERRADRNRVSCQSGLAGGLRPIERPVAIAPPRALAARNQIISKRQAEDASGHAVNRKTNRETQMVGQQHDLLFQLGSRHYRRP